MAPNYKDTKHLAGAAGRIRDTWPPALHLRLHARTAAAPTPTPTPTPAWPSPSHEASLPSPAPCRARHAADVFAETTAPIHVVACCSAVSRASSTVPVSPVDHPRDNGPGPRPLQ